MNSRCRIVTWLTHKQVACWNFTDSDRALLQEFLPGSDIRICRHEAEFLRELPEAEVVLVWRFKQEYFAHAPRLRYISTPAAGNDYFTVTPPDSVKIIYGGFHGPLIAETVLAMMLGHCRGIFATVELRDKCGWPRHQLSAGMKTLYGANVTILGFGRIGKAIGLLVKGLGTRITGIRRTADCPYPGYFTEDDRILPAAALDTVLPETDHLVMVLPRSAETDRIIDARRLALLPNTAAIYNVGRGNAIDEPALVTALKNGDLARACLDVFAVEPLPDDSPLRTCPNAFLMPHASAIAPQYMQCYCRDFADNYLRLA